MWEHYSSLLTKAIFVENLALSFFLGMCSFLACSRRVETALGLGVAVVFVMAITTPLNQLLTEHVLAPGALAWIPGGEDRSHMQPWGGDRSHLQTQSSKQYQPGVRRLPCMGMTFSITL